MADKAWGTVRRQSLGDQTIEAVRHRIRAGEWPVGERIPVEAELVTALGVGRNTVREAVRALVHAGLLETRQGDGTYVRAVSELAGAVRRRAGRALPREVFEVRQCLEAEAAVLAARRRTADDLCRLDALLTRRDTTWAAGDTDGFAAADVAFHQAVVDAAHNDVLSDLYRHLAGAIVEIIRLDVAVHPGTGDQTGMHAPLLAAIRAGDETAARAQTAAYLDEHLRQLGGDAG